MKHIPLSPSPIPITPENASTNEGPAFAERLESFDQQPGNKRSADSALGPRENQREGSMRAALMKKVKSSVAAVSPCVEPPDTGNPQAPASRPSTNTFLATLVAIFSMRYSETASIEDLEEDEALKAISTFEDSLKNLTPESTQVSHERLRDTRAVLNGIKHDVSEKMHILYYKVGEQPVGFLSMDTESFPKDPPYISHLVTHPTWKGRGGALIEGAVNYSQMLGHDGVVEISPGSEKARKIYLSMGFKEGKEFMKLNPVIEHHRWVQRDDGIWQLNQDSKEQRLVSINVSVTPVPSLTFSTT